ncbi:MAG TPA: MFS transporter [Chloroflexota bacterium]
MGSVMHGRFHRVVQGLRPPRGWRRTVYLIAVATFINSTGFMFVAPLLPLMVREVGVTDVQQVAVWSGAIFGIAPLFGGIGAPFWGAVADRTGYKLMLVRTFAAFTIATFLMGFAASPWHLLALRLLIGIFGGFTPVAVAVVTAAAPRERTGQAVGIYQAGQVLGWVMGPLIGGVLGDVVGLRATFFITAFLFVVPMVLIWLFYEEVPRKTTPDAPREQGSRLALLRLPGVGLLLAVVFLWTFVDASYAPIVPLYITRLDPSVEQVASRTGLILSAAAVATAISTYVSGRLTLRFEPQRLMGVGLAAGALLALALSFSRSWEQLLVFRVGLGLFAGGLSALAYAVGGRVFPAQRRGLAFGLMASGGLMGGASSPVIAGAIAAWDFRGVFWVHALLYALCLVWLLRLKGFRVAVSRESAALPRPEGRDAPGPPGISPSS